MTKELPFEHGLKFIFDAANKRAKLADALEHVVMTDEPVHAVAKKFGVPCRTLLRAHKRLPTEGQEFREWLLHREQRNNWD